MIPHLSVRNFLGVRAVDLTLPDPGITLVAADNFSGKTSIQQAIRLALCGEVSRVKLKRDYDMLVRDGADEATIVANIGDTEKRIEIKDGKLSGATTPAHLALPFVLDPSRIAALDEGGLASLLMEAAGIRADAEQVRVRLKEADIPDDYIDAIEPMLASGFAAARGEADSRAKGCAMQWAAHAGEKYGNKKADHWKPDITEQLTDIEQTVADAITARDTISPLKERIDAIVEAGVEITRDYELITAGVTSHHEKCPECQKELIVLSDRSLASKADYTAKLKKRVKVDDMKFALDANAEEFRVASDELDHAMKLIEEADKADETRAKLKADAKTKAETAQAIHRQALTWSRLADLLAPDKIPADLCADVLAAVNHRFLSVAQTFGQVAIARDMSMTFKDRPYGLLSESEKWVCDALLADAIAALAGLNIRMLDRVDVLAPKRRGDLVGWLKRLADEEGVQSILFATLKQPASIPGVTAYWLERGALA